jgi:hypothetical protein
MLETNYALNLEQLFKITLNLKKNLLQKIKSNKPHTYTRSMRNKTIPSIVLDISTTTITMNNHLAIIQIQIGINIILDVLLDGGSWVYIITK